MRESSGPRGTGHPNKYLEADFAVLDGNGEPHWHVRVETFVEIEKAEFDTVKSGLKSDEPGLRKDVATSLIAKVPGSGPESDNAKRMIAAAFGFGFPIPATFADASIGNPTNNARSEARR